MATAPKESAKSIPAHTPTSDDPFDFAPGWRPEPGSTVTGEVISVDMAENQYGPYPVVTVQQDDGEKIALHAFHTVFRNALERARPMPGAKMAVRYVGLVEEDRKGRKLDNPYHGYQVRMLDQTADDVWGKRSPDAPAGSGQFNDEPPWS
jgi:hypothetical protein